MHELKESTDKAAEYLNRNTGYKKNKIAISKLFEKKLIENWDGTYRELVFLRLTVIDGSYSTNSNKVPYSLEELVDKIVDISGGGNPHCLG